MTSKVVRPTKLSGGYSKSRLLPPPQVWLGPVVITLLLWLTRLNDISGIQVLAAFLLLLIPWWSYQYWRQAGSRGLPLFGAITLVYWLYFTVQLFWGNRHALDWRNRRLLGNAAITETMLLVVFGVVFLWLGTKCTAGRRLAPRRLPEISLTPLSVLYVQGLAIMGTLMARYEGLASSGEGWRQAILIVEGTTSQAAVVILFRRVLDGHAAKFEKTLLIAILGVRVVLGVSSGWLGSAASLGLSCALVYLHKNRKIPIAILACLLPYVLFFQAGKEQFRHMFWHNQVQADTMTKAEYWVDSSLKAWQQALEDPSGRGVGVLLSSLLSRTSLLTQTANVLEQTPSIVPYQYGRLYSYMAVALVPRIFWPDKPFMNQANQFYQVAYGITREQDLGNVSIAVGTLTEGYINFGWFGTALVMFLIGVLLDFWNETFLAGTGTVLAVGLGIALVPQLLAVESQMAQYASGLVQHVFLTVVIFLPITRWRLHRARGKASTWALAPPGFTDPAISRDRAATRIT